MMQVELAPYWRSRNGGTPSTPLAQTSGTFPMLLPNARENEEYVSEKVTNWVGEVTKLAEFALSQPQACYAAYTFGLKHRWTYFLRTLPDIQDLLEPLENAISKMLIPTITEHTCSRLALSVRLRGLGMTNPCLGANFEQSFSVKVTAPLVQQIETQSHQLADDSLVKPLQQAVKSERAKALQDRAVHIRELTPQKVQQALDLATEKGSSVWLTVLPRHEMGFNLNKRDPSYLGVLRRNQTAS